MSKTKRTYKMYKGSISTELEKTFHYIYCITYVYSESKSRLGILNRPLKKTSLLFDSDS